MIVGKFSGHSKALGHTRNRRIMPRTRKEKLNLINISSLTRNTHLQYQTP